MPTFSSRSKICGDSDGLLPIMGTMLIDSHPPAIITSDSPTRIRSAAIANAVTPEAQNRFTVTPPTEFGACQQRADTRHVQALLAFGNRATDDRVFDQLRIKSRHLRDR